MSLWEIDQELSQLISIMRSLGKDLGLIKRVSGSYNIAARWWTRRKKCRLYWAWLFRCIRR